MKIQMLLLALQLLKRQSMMATYSYVSRALFGFDLFAHGCSFVVFRKNVKLEDGDHKLTWSDPEADVLTDAENSEAAQVIPRPTSALRHNSHEIEEPANAM
jgi:hypothetical protein